MRFTNSPDPARRLRVGYVAGHLHDRAMTQICFPFLDAHQGVEVFLYANEAGDAALAERLAVRGRHFVPIQHLSHEQAAARIREDAIVILVDLSGHAARNRMPVFARKSAPIQLSWLGYPGPTGLAAIDYRSTDAVADPPGDGEGLDSERLLRIERGFVCFAAPEAAGGVAEPRARPSGEVTFGCFTSVAKLSPSTIVVWARLLRELPASRLLVEAPQFRDRGTRERIAAAFASADIAAERLELVAPRPTSEERLARYATIDIAKAAALGWTVDELLGLHPTAPLARYDRIGLIWFLQGRDQVVALDSSRAKLSSGLSFYRRAQQEDGP